MICSSLNLLFRIVRLLSTDSSSERGHPQGQGHDLCGYGEAKEWALGAVEDFKRIRAGEPAHLVAALLAGAPGTGKTRMLQSIARTTGATLVSASVANWFARSAGDLDAVIKAAIEDFDRALENSPSVLFVDELDALPSRDRLNSRNADWWLPVITAVLLQIDRLKASSRAVLLVAATNHPDRIDSAMIRPGRIDRTIHMVIPEGAELAGIIRQYAPTELTDTEIASVVEIVGRATGAQVVNWIETARRLAKHAGLLTFGFSHLLAAVSPPDHRTPEQIRDIAVHEAAHAVVAHAFGFDVERVSIIGAGRIGGLTSVETERLTRRQDFEAHITVALAGRAGDELFGGGADAGAEADLRIATRLATVMRATVGLAGSLTHHDPDLLAQKLLVDRGFAADVEADLGKARNTARSILQDRHDLHAAIVDALTRSRVLDRHCLERIVKKWKGKKRSEKVPAYVTHTP